MKSVHIILTSIISFCIISCNNENQLDIVSSGGTIETPDWTETSHSNLVDPNYDAVFPNDYLFRFDITISTENWSAMQSDLATNFGVINVGSELTDIDFSPIWVPCSFKFNGREWYKVGIRYKGNSSLRAAFQGDSDKYPFKLDFDEFEDDYPAIKNQRFFGFKQLNLSNNHEDGSFIREKVAADLFREFGVPAAHTAFAAVYLDRGKGSTFIGLYTLVEEVDDTVIETQFSNKDGNLYKPEGTGASFAQGSYNTIEMNKKTNEDEEDFSDVKSLYELLHSPLRSTDIDQWKSDLELVFNVDQFLKYFAVNNTIQNWDTYGKMPHNYFLYNYENKLNWIPWDHNEAFQEGKLGGALSLSASEVSNEWPIIRYIMDIDQYKATYDNYLRDFVDGVFEHSNMATTYSKYGNLLREYAIQEASSFDVNVFLLKQHAVKRNEAVKIYLE